MDQIALASGRTSRWATRGLTQLSLIVVWVLALVIGAPQVGRWAIVTLPQLLLSAVALGALYTLPGLAVLRLLWRDASLTRLEYVVLAIGLSVALPPLLLEATHGLGLRWNRGTTWLYLILALIIGLARRLPSRWRAPSLRLSWSAWMLAGLTLVAALVRLYIVRDLPAGLWGDSYHHTMITQLLVDNGGLFSSWQPYAPLATFTYHYGFHANAAFIHWLTGLPATQSVVLAGQLLSIATVPLAFGFTSRLSGSAMAGVWAAALTGFANTQPAFYVNWGRYTQLAGQIILPIVIICWMTALQDRHWNWRHMLLAATTTACLILTHYLVTLVAAVFVLIYIGVRVVQQPRWRALRSLLGASALITAGTTTLAAPWMWNIARGYWDQLAVNHVTRPVQALATSSTATLLPLNPTYLKTYIVVLALIGLSVAVWQRRWRMMLFGGWSVALLALVVPYKLGLPGTGVINNFTAFIALYVTAIPLAGYTLGIGQTLIAGWQPRIVSGLATLLLIGLSVWGVRWQQSIIEPQFELLTPADAAAMTWIKAQTPTDARFLVNMFPAYGNSLFVGDDGGWWIPLLTGRQSTLPPITYVTERTDDPTYRQQINQFGFALLDHPLPSPEGMLLLRQAHVTHIYIGPHESTNPRIDVAALRQRPDLFRPLYARDGVEIFALENAP